MILEYWIALGAECRKPPGEIATPDMLLEPIQFGADACRAFVLLIGWTGQRLYMSNGFRAAPADIAGYLHHSCRETFPWHDLIDQASLLKCLCIDEGCGVEEFRRARRSDTFGQRHRRTAGGTIPYLACPSPILASLAAMMMSQARSSSRPPATAVPFAAPMTGTGRSSTIWMTS